uniref:Uncharacterized protein n=1 Tax=Palpitomonas bilix TaxID=652834 RepID=A0A7S3G445_9EUKA
MKEETENTRGVRKVTSEGEVGVQNEVEEAESKEGNINGEAKEREERERIDGKGRAKNKEGEERGEEGRRQEREEGGKQRSGQHENEKRDPTFFSPPLSTSHSTPDSRQVAASVDQLLRETVEKSIAFLEERRDHNRCTTAKSTARRELMYGVNGREEERGSGQEGGEKKRDSVSEVKEVERRGEEKRSSGEEVIVSNSIYMSGKQGGKGEESSRSGTDVSAKDGNSGGEQQKEARNKGKPSKSPPQSSRFLPSLYLSPSGRGGSNSESEKRYSRGSDGGRSVTNRGDSEGQSTEKANDGGMSRRSEDKEGRSASEREGTEERANAHSEDERGRGENGNDDADAKEGRKFMSSSLSFTPSPRWYGTHSVERRVGRGRKEETSRGKDTSEDGGVKAETEEKRRQKREKEEERGSNAALLQPKGEGGEKEEVKQDRREKGKKKVGTKREGVSHPTAIAAVPITTVAVRERVREHGSAERVFRPSTPQLEHGQGRVEAQVKKEEGVGGRDKTEKKKREEEKEREGKEEKGQRQPMPPPQRKPLVRSAHTSPSPKLLRVHRRTPPTPPRDVSSTPSAPTSTSGQIGRGGGGRGVSSVTAEEEEEGRQEGGQKIEDERSGEDGSMGCRPTSRTWSNWRDRSGKNAKNEEAHQVEVERQKLPPHLRPASTSSPLSASSSFSTSTPTLATATSTQSGGKPNSRVSALSSFGSKLRQLREGISSEYEKVKSLRSRGGGGEGERGGGRAGMEE